MSTPRREVSNVAEHDSDALLAATEAWILSKNQLSGLTPDM